MPMVCGHLLRMSLQFQIRTSIPAGQRAFIGVSAEFQMASLLPIISPPRNATWIGILHPIT